MYDVRLPNLIELSGEMYDLYMVNQDTGDFIVKNKTSYIMIFCRKEDRKSFMFAEHLNNITDSIKELGDIKMTYVDEQLDPELQAAFDTRMQPHVFFIDGEDGMAYSWDYFLDPTNFTSWIKDKTYKESPLKFKAPKRLRHAELMMFHRYMRTKFNYIIYVGQHIDRFIFDYMPFLLEIPPLNKVYLDKNED